MFFGRNIETIEKHINDALNEELDNSVVVNFATTELSIFPFKGSLMCFHIV